MRTQARCIAWAVPKFALQLRWPLGPGRRSRSRSGQSSGFAALGFGKLGLRSLGLSSLACLTLGLAGCGWHAGSVAPEGAKTVGVEVFWTTERVLERDLEPALQRELTRAVIDLSGLALVRVREADLVVRGKILEYRRRGGIRSQDNELLETGVRLLIEAELYDPVRDEVLRSAPARIWSGYALVSPGEEVQAQERALRHLAETLTLNLFTPLDEQIVEEAPKSP